MTRANGRTANKQAELLGRSLSRSSACRRFGATVGRDVHVFPSVRIAIPWHVNIGDQAAIGDRAILYALGTIVIGAEATISQQAHLCAGSHDWRDPTMALTKPPITIGDGVWICADAFIGPGVTVGERAIVGARAVATVDVPAGAIVAGNPARLVRMRDADNAPAVHTMTKQRTPSA